MRDGEYKLLAKEVDLATAVVAVLMTDWRASETQENKDLLDLAESDQRKAQQKLEDHVEKHGIPEVENRW